MKTEPSSALVPTISGTFACWPDAKIWAGLCGMTQPSMMGSKAHAVTMISLALRRRKRGHVGAKKFEAGLLRGGKAHVGRGKHFAAFDDGPLKEAPRQEARSSASRRRWRRRIHRRW